ncbi:uncharacterized protein LOC114300609 [Camellia sinensis]|uniref:uncharacterized protein LOC114300609 n=1 Tax=Camellia sinensis TaxID=4442 RepID=UPI0010366708|nr:uncharacterized protein LOC114300609 [Camellia sinensis]
MDQPTSYIVPGSEHMNKDSGQRQYFLGIEIAHSSRGLFLSQRKYVLDLLSETSLLGTCPSDAPMNSLVKLDGETRALFPDIVYACSSPTHFDVVCHILRYLKRALDRSLLYRSSPSLSVTAFSDADWAGSWIDCHSTSGYCTFVGGNLVNWCSDKQLVVAHSSAEAEYRVMAHTASKML